MTENTLSETGDVRREQNINLVRRFFELMREKDIEGWGKLWNEDARIIIPYPPSGFPDAIEGLSSQILPGFRQLFAGFKSYDYQIKEIYPTTEPDVIIVEWDVTAELRADGATYQGNNITVFKFRDKKIAEYHDYFNPEKFKLVVESSK